MKQEDMWHDFTLLPLEAQEQVIEFIAALKARYAASQQIKRMRRKNLADEPFVGMWRDRTEMQDSSAWVRDLRGREWMKSNG